MKKIFALLFLLFVECRSDKTSCGSSDERVLEHIQCYYEKSPAIFQQRFDILHQCIEKFYKKTEKFKSISLYQCGELSLQFEDINNCVKEKKLEELDDDILMQFYNAFVDCFVEILNRKEHQDS